MGAWRPVEYEIEVDGSRTGKTRYRQFTLEYAKAARSGIWPADRSVIDTWAVPFK